jgi:hypothetical protein
MTDRNAPCPCGSGKKFKKCHGASGTAAPGAGDAKSPNPAAPVQPAPPSSSVSPAPPSSTHSPDDRPFLVHTGRGLDSERTDQERRKHLRKRIQSPPLRGTLVYNSGAFFKPPNPQD